MGGAASKASRAARAAAPPPTSTTPAATPRKYPARVPPTARVASPAPGTAGGAEGRRPEARASYVKDDAIHRDGTDPDLARRLRTLGPVALPSFRPGGSGGAPEAADDSGRDGTAAASSPALALFRAREELEIAATAEFAQVGRPGFPGRRFVDALTLREALVLRDENGLAARDIEQRLGLKEGIVEQLGPRGVVEAC